jgi:DNA-binding LacI/PurR family transcriptional regulator
MPASPRPPFPGFSTGWWATPARPGERVETAAKSLSYETDYLARGLKTRQTSVIGLLAPMVSDALASQVMQGVEEEAQERGYVVMPSPGSAATSAP